MAGIYLPVTSNTRLESELDGPRKLHALHELIPGAAGRWIQAEI
jgi:hypothetical protein